MPEPYFAALAARMASVSMGVDLEQVAADAVVGDLEDRRGVVLVDRDDALGLAHTGLVLDGAGDTESDIDLRVDGLTGLTDLMVGSEPAGVDGNTGAANNAAEHIGELVSELDAALDVLGDTTADGDDIVSANQVDELLGSLDDLDDPSVWRSAASSLTSYLVTLTALAFASS